MAKVHHIPGCNNNNNGEALFIIIMWQLTGAEVLTKAKTKTTKESAMQLPHIEQ